MLKYIRQAALVLILSMVCGVALAAVNSLLADRIRQNVANTRAKAALMVVDKAVRAELASDIKSGMVYRVYDGANRQLGWAVLGTTTGYSGSVDVVFGLNVQATEITGMKVLQNTETPGLGSKITSASFQNKFKGKSTQAPLQAVKSTASEGNQIQAITGATISSQAACRAINEPLQAVRAELLAAGVQEGAQ